MTNQNQNLFIVDDNQENASKLHQIIEKRFGTIYNIFIYTNAVQALTQVDKNTSIVVLDYNYFGEDGTKIANLINNINDETKVIILSNNAAIVSEISSYFNRSNDYLETKKEVKKKLNRTFLEIVSYPANYLQMRYGVSRYFIYLVFLFLGVGILVFLGMQTIY
ncbi:MAG: response regulator [Flavobacterium sp.]|nr:response regulator [Flavobacterium sp.]